MATAIVVCVSALQAAPAAPAAADLVMGRYDVVIGKRGMLGEGSFSIVQRALDTKTNTEVAIKTYKLGTYGDTASKSGKVLVPDCKLCQWVHVCA